MLHLYLLADNYVDFKDSDLLCAFDESYAYQPAGIPDVKHVHSAQFSLNIDEVHRQALSPPIVYLSNQYRHIFLYSNIRYLKGRTVVHRWIYEDPKLHRDRVMAKVVFRVKGPRWRVWSGKNLSPTQLGRWRVEIIDQENGVVYQHLSFHYVKAAELKKVCY